MMIQRWFCLLFLACNSYYNLSCSAFHRCSRSPFIIFSNHNIIINYHRRNPLHSVQQQSSSSSTAVNPVDEPINVFDKAELIKLFGRLADAKMLLDVPGLVSVLWTDYCCDYHYYHTKQVIFDEVMMLMMN